MNAHKCIFRRGSRINRNECAGDATPSTGLIQPCDAVFFTAAISILNNARREELLQEAVMKHWAAPPFSAVKPSQYGLSNHHQ